MLSAFDEHIKFLTVQYPGTFDALESTELRETGEVPTMAYHADDNVIMYNAEILDFTSDEQIAIIAFIGILINNPDYHYPPEKSSDDWQAFNMAVQAKVIHELRTLGSFHLPDAAFRCEFDVANLTLDEIYQKYLALRDEELTNQ